MQQNDNILSNKYIYEMKHKLNRFMNVQIQYSNTGTILHLVLQEVYVTNEQMLCLLYHEAKFNIIEGRYVLYSEDYHRLAGLQVLNLFNMQSFVPFCSVLYIFPILSLFCSSTPHTQTYTKH